MRRGIVQGVAQAPADGVPMGVHRRDDGQREPRRRLLLLLVKRIMVGVHEKRVQAPAKALPHPGLVAADAPQMIGVGEDHLAAVRGGRVVAVAALGVGRDPVGGTVKERGVVAPPARLLERHAHGVLLGLARS